MEVLYQVLLVGLQRRPTAARVVAPRGEKASGNLVVGVPDNLADEGELPFTDLLLYRGNMAEAHLNGTVCDVFINYLYNCDV